LLFHSMEVVAGASPYPQTDAQVARYLDDLDAVFARARELGFSSRTLSGFAAECTPAGTSAMHRERVDPAAWTQAARTAAASRIRLAGVDPLAVLEAHGVQPWFGYSFRQRHERWDLCLACEWLRSHLPSDAAILDLGCGTGFNLLWLAERGCTDLQGCDVDPKAIAAARELAERSGHEIRYWVDDGRALEGVPRRTFAAVCALNWTQLTADFDLAAFLRQARALVADGGVLVLDYIDRAFGQDPRHRFLTSDWDRPEEERRPSEYPTRFAPEALAFSLQRNGFAVERHWHAPGTVPRGLMIARKAAVAAAPLPLPAMPARSTHAVVPALR
jgi:SAM-dependent methyltransferase